MVWFQVLCRCSRCLADKFEVLCRSLPWLVRQFEVLCRPLQCTVGPRFCYRLHKVRINQKMKKSVIVMIP